MRTRVLSSVDDLPWEDNDIVKSASLPADLRRSVERWVNRVKATPAYRDDCRRALVYLADGRMLSIGCRLGECSERHYAMATLTEAGAVVDLRWGLTGLELIDLVNECAMNGERVP